MALETAALSLFEAHGYDETTVEQIAEVADVSTRTFFRYFPTKVDVLLSDQVARLTMVRDFLASRPEHEPIMATLRALLTAISVDLPEERHLLAAEYRWCSQSDDLLAAIRNHHAAIVDLLAEFITARLETPDPLGGRAAAIATACIACLVVVATDWIGPEGGELPDVESAITSLESAIHVPA